MKYIMLIAAITATTAINESLFCDHCTNQYEKCVPCQPLCPKTCENPEGRGFCNEQCLEPVTCVCQEGYLRDEESGQCILPCECPMGEDSTTPRSSTTKPCTLDT